MKEHEIGIAWWKEVLRAQPARDALGKTRDKNMESAQVIGTMLGKVNAPSEEQLEQFGNALLSLVRSPDFRGILSCDYDPDATLLAAAILSGIDNSAFPWKTTMWIKHGYVAVKHGYGAKAQVLYQTQENQIGSTT